MNSRRLSAALVLLFCAGCTAEPTPAATPTPIPPTPTPFEAPDLEPIFVDRRLLPPRATAVETVAIPHPTFEDLPVSEHFFSVVYSRGADFSGRVSIFLYAHPEELDFAWPRVLDLIVTPNEIQGIGDLAAVDHSDMAFIRCMTLVHIKLIDSDPFELRTYAETLDAKLAPEVCP